MASDRFLLARDTVNGAEGQIFITLNGRNAEVAGMRNINTNASIQSDDMRVIGTRKIQEKHNGVKLTGTGNIYYGSNLFIDMVLQYINTGVMPEFDIQIINNDPATSIGTQNMVYTGCTLTGDIPLSILNDEEAMLNFDFNFTISDVSRLEKFGNPAIYGGGI